jgi:hypothetical protein
MAYLSLILEAPKVQLRTADGTIDGVTLAGISGRNTNHLYVGFKVREDWREVTFFLFSNNVTGPQVRKSKAFQSDSQHRWMTEYMHDEINLPMIRCVEIANYLTSEWKRRNLK